MQSLPRKDVTFRLLALPVFAVGFFCGIFFRDLPTTPSPPSNPQAIHLSTESPPSAAYRPPPLRYTPLGPEFTEQSWWEGRDSNRTLYVAPYTGLANTLQTVASVLRIAHEQNVNIKFVFHRPWTGPAKWSELFSFPVIDDNQTFPDGATSIYDTKSCTYGKPPFGWKNAELNWTASSEGEIGCVMTCCWREPPFPQSALWFYRLLRPSLPLQKHINALKERHNWDNYQWVGMHFRRTDNIQTMKDLMKFFTDPELRRAVNQTTAESMLPTQHYLQLAEGLSRLWPVHDLGVYQVVKPFRLFLATDSGRHESRIRSFFPAGTVVSFEKGFESGIRNTVWGMQTGVIDLFLLASCHVVIGTPFSTFSEAAAYIGGALLLEPNFDYGEEIGV